MGADGDEVTLSEWERDRLAAIESELAVSDPALTRRLSGDRRARVRAMMPATLLIFGLAVVLATFTWSLALATVGLAMMAVGAKLAANRLVMRVRRFSHARPRPDPPGR